MADRKRNVKVSDVVLDYNLYPRHEVDTYHVTEIKEALEAGAELPPIIIDAESKRVIDGFHRVGAIKKLGGEDATVAAILRDYESEAAMFEEAMRLNSAHGRTLTKYDKLRCISLAQNLGVEMPKIAEALHITRERIAGYLVTRYSADKTPLKGTTRHMANKHLTEAQEGFNRDAGGLNQSFYVNQLIRMLETGSVNWQDERLVARLKTLYELLSGAEELKQAV